jgi:hypothetical protein
MVMKPIKVSAFPRCIQLRSIRISDANKLTFQINVTRGNNDDGINYAFK